MDDLDDLLGDDPPVITDALPPATAFLKPVGVTFLAEILGKQPRSLYARLARCPVKEYCKKGNKQFPLYDFLEAMSYLVTPKGNIEEWFASKNAASLPPYVNKMFWDSANQRNRVMRSSNDLWHTDDVMLVLGRVAMMIKEEVKMWVEELPEKDALTNEQYNALIDASNRLLANVRERLVDMPSHGLTEASMSRTIEAELEAGGGMPVEDMPEDE
ncbi:hypothetical protein ACFQXB_06155 [Plastorhodobacter daqingensis]|uniref:DUF1441 family protein n=1 Tax=Plastorhodobacter daqingensis TaxID=1387281 RepID=A0ABW2UIF8_9RHOB